jgi:hypothetical protein
MKAQNMTIDINKLNTYELEQLRAMFFNLNMMDEVGQINDRIAFINGWMNEKQEKEYVNKYCA